MKSNLSSLLRPILPSAALMLALATAAVAAPAPDPGYCDFGTFKPATKGPFVEVNVSPAVIRFAARLASTQDPAAAALLENLRQVRVNVVTVDDGNRAETLSRIESVRRQLSADGWTPIVTVRGQDNGENVDVHVKMQADDTIDGLVVTVLDGKGEAVFVNIVGNISADRIAELAQRFDIEPLRKLKLPASAKS